MRRKAIWLLLVAVAVVAGLGVYAIASREQTVSYTMGSAFSDASTNTADRVVAAYKDSQITQSVVDYEKQNMTFLKGGEAVTDKEATEQLLRNIIMLDEAERLGITVTQDEVDEVLSMQRKNYDEYEDARVIVDDFCQGAGITTEEYFSIVEDQLSRMILRQKLRDALGQEYCDQHGLTFTKVNPPKEMEKYVDGYLDDLLKIYRADITYYDVDE